MKTKDRILEYLEENRGNSVSGETIAKSLSLSRSAVWKCVKELQQEGFDISAGKRRGYCLSRENNLLSLPAIQKHLNQNCFPFRGRILIFPTLESTNQTAKEMAQKGARHGTVILAEGQSRGRGRYSRSFFSPPGDGLYLSFILRPEELHLSKPGAITAFAGVSVCEAIAEVSGREPQIKWVNDVLLDGKKVCGILTEAVTDLESGAVEWIVLGIGINVDTKKDDFPEEIRELATSIFPEEKMPGMRNRLTAAVINRILGWDEEPEEKVIFDQYRKKLMLFGKKIAVFQNGSTFIATALGVNDEGHLLVEKENGERLFLSSGEVSIRY